MNERKIQFLASWKRYVARTNPSARSFAVYGIMKAVLSNSNTHKTELATNILQKMFSPHNKPWMAVNGYHQWKGLELALPSGIKKGTVIFDDFEISEEEAAAVTTICGDMFKSLQRPETFGKIPVSYFVTRQDIFPEYQLVQTAHAALVLGQNMTKDVNGRGLTFVVLGAKNLESLEEIAVKLDEAGIKFERFVEPDIGDQLTSIGIHPQLMSNRDRKTHILANIPRLKFGG